MAKAKIKEIDDDDEKGTAKNDAQQVAVKADNPEAAERNLDKAMELSGEDGEKFTDDQRIMRALSLAPIDEDATAKYSEDLKAAGKGLPRDEIGAIGATVRKVGKKQYIVVTTEQYRKFARAL